MSKAAASLFILRFMVGYGFLAVHHGSANVVDPELSIMDQGWRRHHTPQGRQELKDNVAKWQERPLPPSTMERWASRDKKVMTPGRRATLERLEAQAGLTTAEVDASESMLASFLMFVFLGVAVAVLMTVTYACMKSRGHVASNGKPLNLDLEKMELIQQAVIVMRHTSTRGMDRALDFAEFAADFLGRSVTNLTTKVKQTRRQMKKDDPEMETNNVDFLELDDDDVYKPNIDPGELMDLEQLKFQCQQMSNDHVANSYVVAKSKPMSFESIAMPAVVPPEDIKIDVQTAVENSELTEFVDEDCDSDKEVSKEQPGNLEPIDQLVGKIAAVL